MSHDYTKPTKIYTMKKGDSSLTESKVNIDLMSNRIHEILEVVRIGMIPYDFKVNSSEEIVKNVLVTLEDKLESNNINIQIKHNLPNIFCDENRIRDVFYNLVTNAIKFMGNDKQSKSQ